MCDMTDLYVCHDSFTCATWLIHMCDMAHSYVRRDSSTSAIHGITHMKESCHTYGWGMSHIWMSHVTHMDEPLIPWIRHDSFIYEPLIRYDSFIRIRHWSDMTHSFWWAIDPVICRINRFFISHIQKRFILCITKAVACVNRWLSALTDSLRFLAIVIYRSDWYTEVIDSVHHGISVSLMNDNSLQIITKLKYNNSLQRITNSE
jgi:hypothetical protein